MESFEEESVTSSKEESVRSSKQLSFGSSGQVRLKARKSVKKYLKKKVSKYLNPFKEWERKVLFLAEVNKIIIAESVLCCFNEFMYWLMLMKLKSIPQVMKKTLKEVLKALKKKVTEEFKKPMYVYLWNIYIKSNQIP
nr:putative late blight resistance protein homolog R1A-3 isoform X1 [Ipomoea batatas]